MIINMDKSLALGLQHKLNKNIVFPNIIPKDGQITHVSGTKFLGVWLNHKLNCDLHTENSLKKLSKLCFAIKTLRSSV
jgi:hypothetical protein